jgi:FixJ family two-component response regulator
MPSQPITVYVVDDDASVRKSVSRLLRSVGHLTENFATPAEFLAHCRNTPLAGCALLDVQMPGLNGLELQRELLAANVEIPIIFITGHGDIPMSVKAMKAGAVDFLAKPFREEDLLTAVNEAIARHTQQQTQRDTMKSLAERHATLTPRERDVMVLVVCGLLNKQIAARLGASEKTIKIHRGRVMHKMQVHSVPDLVRAAEQLGISSAHDACPVGSPHL